MPDLPRIRARVGVTGRGRSLDTGGSRSAFRVARSTWTRTTPLSSECILREVDVRISETSKTPGPRDRTSIRRLLRCGALAFSSRAASHATTPRLASSSVEGASRRDCVARQPSPRTRVPLPGDADTCAYALQWHNNNSRNVYLNGDDQRPSSSSNQMCCPKFCLSAESHKEQEFHTEQEPSPSARSRRPAVSGAPPRAPSCNSLRRGPWFGCV